MNRTLQFILSLLVALPVLAQSHDNRLYLTVGEITDNKVELSLHLANPTIALTAVELYVTLPDGAVLSAGSPTARAEGHLLTEGATASGHFVSIASPSLAAFTGADGVLCSWVVDLSQLPLGDYSILASGLFAVGVDADNTITAYTAEDQTLGATTSIAAPTGEAGKLIIYNMNGQRIASPQRGQVNIVNGKKVLPL